MKNSRAAMVALLLTCNLIHPIVSDALISGTWKFGIFNVNPANYSSIDNWTSGLPPTDTAYFSGLGIPNVSIVQNVTLNQIVFSPGAQAYVLSVNPPNNQYVRLTLTGTGLNNNSSVTQTLNVSASGSLVLNNLATLNNMKITTLPGSVISLTDNASINNSLVNVTGSLVFNASANAGSGNITNNGDIYLHQYSSLASASVTNGLGSHLYFYDDSSAGQSTIANNFMGTVDISNVSGSSLNLYHVSGNGNFILGAKTLVLGGPSEAIELDGNITGTTGGLNKVGTNVLTLGGANSYSGLTTVSQGVLRIISQGSLPGDVLDNSQLQFDPATNMSYAGSITGSGSLFKSGDGELTLTGTNNYSGVTLVRGKGALIGNTASLKNNIDNEGTVVFDQGSDDAYAGIMSGTGKLIKRGNGILTLAGANTYTGGTLVSAGTVAGTTTGLRGPITNNAHVIFNQDDDGSYDDVMSGSGDLTKSGVGTLNLTGANTYTGMTYVNAGILQLTSANIQRDITNNATVIFNQDQDGAWNGVMSGSGALIKKGSGVLGLAGNSTHTGGTTIDSGEIYLTGKLAGTTQIEINGTLSGTGTAGILVNRGLIDPGTHGTGTLKAAGLSGPGILSIHFDGRPTNQLAVSGPVDLADSTLRLSGTRFTPGSYTVITSQGASNTFAQVQAPAFLNYETDIRGFNVNVIVHSFSYSSPARTQNQMAVGSALDATQASPVTTSPMLPKLSALQTLSQAQSALESLSGDAWTGFADVAFKNLELFSNNVLDRAVPMDSSRVAPLDQPIRDPQRGLWTRAVGGAQHIDSDTTIGSPATKATTEGFQAGYDHQFGESTTGGLAMGYVHTSLSIDDREASGHTNAIGVMLYARHPWHAWIFNSGVGLLRSSEHLSRAINFSSENASADPSSQIYTAFGEAAYAFEPWVDTAIEPSVGLRISHFSQSSFSESGAPDANLAFASQSLNSVVPSMNARLSHLFHAEGRHPFVIGGKLGVQSELADVNRALSGSFVSSPATAFTINGTPQKRVGVNLGLHGRLALRERLQIYATYEVEIKRAHSSQGYFGGMRWTW